MKPKSILVTGKNGQLGLSLQKLVTGVSSVPPISDNSVFTFVGRDELDLSSASSISAYFTDKRFDIIINCAAYTAVDKAESESELADMVNHLAVKQLAQIAKQQNAFMLHISTDYVFDGLNNKPYVESDELNPQNVYGLTKLNGERAMQQILDTGCIIRTSWVYSEYGNNFVKNIIRLSENRDFLDVIFDQFGSPTYAIDLARVILEILNNKIRSNNSSLFDIYHYSNEGVASWFDFTKAIVELSGKKCRINPIESNDYPTLAKRPSFSMLNKTKIKNEYNIEIPFWRDSLIECIKELKHDKQK